VSGVIDSVGKDMTDTMYVSLKGGGEFEMRGVQCFFADSDKGQLTGLSKGRYVTIKGKCEGLMMNVLLNRSSWPSFKRIHGRAKGLERLRASKCSQ
jgi:hypothetical protein